MNKSMVPDSEPRFVPPIQRGTPNRLVADLHIHTIASGHAFSTVEEIARSAKKKGLELIALTDHGPALPGGAHLYHFFNTRVIPDEIDGVRILKGAEANVIGPDGEIDIPDDLVAELDIILLALHYKTGYDGKTKEEHTAALIAAMEKHQVDILAHAGNPLFELDYDAVAKKAKEKNIAVEFNNSSYLPTTSRHGSYELDMQMAKAVKKYSNAVTLGSDAHIASDVGNFDKALELIETTGIKENQVLNYSSEKVLDFIS